MERANWPSNLSSVSGLDSSNLKLWSLSSDTVRGDIGLERVELLMELADLFLKQAAHRYDRLGSSLLVDDRKMSDMFLHHDG